MKKRNALIEALNTKVGKVFAILAGVVAIAGVCLNEMVSDELAWKKPAVMVVSCILIALCAMFTQVVGTIQNDITKAEKEEQQQNKHPKKKK